MKQLKQWIRKATSLQESKKDLYFVFWFSVDSLCSQRQISDVCETGGISDQAVGKLGGNDNGTGQQGGDGANEEGTGDEQQDAQLTSSSNTSSVNTAKAIPTNEADMLCTTIENVSHVRFEWTVEDFYPQM